MAIKRFNNEAVMDQEIQFAKKWLHAAKQHLAMAEDNLRQVSEMVCREENPGKELLRLLQESGELVRVGRDRVTFFDGVLVGMLQMRKALRERGAKDTKNPFELYRK